MDNTFEVEPVLFLNFQLNFQRIFFPHPANYSLNCTTNEVAGIAKMRLRLQNSKCI